jgi:hypothetical protein
LRTGSALQVLEGGEELVVHEVEQLVAGHAFGSAAQLRQRMSSGWGFVGVAGEFQLFFERVKHLEEQQPGELADALGVAIDAAVLAHDVLDGFDDGGEVGHEGFGSVL